MTTQDQLLLGSINALIAEVMEAEEEPCTAAERRKNRVFASKRRKTIRSFQALRAEGERRRKKNKKRKEEKLARQ